MEKGKNRLFLANYICGFYSTDMKDTVYCSQSVYLVSQSAVDRVTSLLILVHLPGPG